MQSIRDSLISLAAKRAIEKKPMPDAFIASIKDQSRQFAARHNIDITPAMQIVIDYMPNAVARTRRDKQPFITEDRGLMLVGATGTGKSVAMAFLANYGKIRMVDACSMMRLFTCGGDAEFFAETKRLDQFPIILDDLGAERDAMSYGNTSPIAEWIQDRYRSWQSGGPELHIVTNLSRTAIVDRYGDRVADRLNEFCIPAPISGSGMRKRDK